MNLELYFWGYSIQESPHGAEQDPRAAGRSGPQTEVDLFLLGSETLGAGGGRSTAARRDAARGTRGAMPGVHTDNVPPGGTCRYWELEGLGSSGSSTSAPVRRQAVTDRRARPLPVGPHAPPGQDARRPSGSPATSVAHPARGSGPRLPRPVARLRGESQGDEELSRRLRVLAPGRPARTIRDLAVGLTLVRTSSQVLGPVDSRHRAFLPLTSARIRCQSVRPIVPAKSLLLSLAETRLTGRTSVLY